MTDPLRKCGCGSGCDFEDDKEPCYGEVHAVDEWHTDEDWGWVHACTGHFNVWDGGKYEPEP